MPAIALLTPLLLSVILGGCASQAVTTASADRSILVLVEDDSHDNQPHHSSVARRLEDGIDEQLNAAGFSVYDRSVLGNVDRDHHRLNGDNLVDLARHSSDRHIDIAAATTVQVSITPVRDYSQRIRVRVSGRALDVQSGKLLGTYEWSDTETGQIRVSSNCTGSCLKETVGDHAREIGQTVGRDIAQLLGASVSSRVQQVVQPLPAAAETYNANEIFEALTVESGAIDSRRINLDIQFELNSAKLTPQATTQLDELGKALQRRSQDVFEIAGHTDSLGSSDYNLTLSEQRAAAVINYLVNVHKLNARKLVATGYGERFPRAGRAAGDPLNRRVEIINHGRWATTQEVRKAAAGKTQHEAGTPAEKEKPKTDPNDYF